MKKTIILALLSIFVALGATAKSQPDLYIYLKNDELVTFKGNEIDSVVYIGENLGFKVYVTGDRSHDFLMSQIVKVETKGNDDTGDGNANRNALSSYFKTNASTAESWRLEFPHLREDNNQSWITKRTADYGITYSAEWDNSLIANRWSAYELYAGNLVDNASRQNDFKEDPELPEATRSTLEDYKGSGFSRGHLCPSADRVCSSEQNKQTFFLSNMHPQWQSHNGGQWSQLEDDVRKWAEHSSCDTLYVVKAATISDVVLNGTTQAGLFDIKCNGRLPVPKYFYMALLAYNKTENKYYGMGIWTIQFSSTSDKKPAEYITIDELEKRTGLDFFCNLPDDIEDEVEATLDTSYWNKATVLTR